MNKQQYLTELTNRLSVLSVDERSDILRDVEEHFREAAAMGRSEDSVVTVLGEPKVFAEMMIAESKVKRIENAPSIWGKFRAIMGAVFAVILLTPFNLIFILLPLLFATLFVALGWVIIGLGVVSIPIAGLAAIGLMIVVGWHVLLLGAVAFAAIGWIGMMIAVAFLFYHLTLLYIKGISWLFSWNLQFIKRSMR